MEPTPIKVEVEKTDTGIKVFSPQFDDIFFNPDCGREETDFVFLKPNRLPERLLENISSSSTPHLAPLTITELGFGTGLNFFLLLEKLWLAVSKINQQNSTPVNLSFNFNTVEKYPLPLKDFQQVLEGLNYLIPPQPLQTFLSFWENNSVGENQLTLVLDLNLNLELEPTSKSSSKITIHFKLFLGDVDDFNPSKTDVWFLDGFAPGKNPKMWSEKVFAMIQNRSNQGATFSTFTSAGFVRRGLTEHGFQVSRVAGFGKKKEMLMGEKK